MSHLQIGVQIDKSIYQLNETDPRKKPQMLIIFQDKEETGLN